MNAILSLYLIVCLINFPLDFHVLLLDKPQLQNDSGPDLIKLCVPLY